MTYLARTQSPEEQELASKQSELAALEENLAERELELATLQNELDAFEVRYLRSVGSLYARLDDLEAQIAEVHARRRPTDQNLKGEAAEARARASDSQRAASLVRDIGEAGEFAPTDVLRKLYRELARQIHPDLATNEVNRLRRNRLMAQANEAYAAANEAQLRAILDEWNHSPETVEGEGIAAELVRTIRRIHQVHRRLADIVTRLSDLRSSELYKLNERVFEAQGRGRDLLAEMAEELKRKIDAVNIRLRAALASEAKA